jgi:hypothetical protein
VKRHLKKKPENFKVIVTSRKLIPSGFRQIQLEGLDLIASKQLMKKMFARYKNSHQPDLTDEQRDEIHKVTYGIPIIIKHCLGQIYEFNRSFNDVVRGLSKASSKVIEFSFKEVINLLKRDEHSLKILILLELIKKPLIIRQISDILEIDEVEIENKLPDLISFQCVDRINIGIEEK